VSFRIYLRSFKDSILNAIILFLIIFLGLFLTMAGNFDEREALLASMDNGDEVFLSSGSRSQFSLSPTSQSFKETLDSISGCASAYCVSEKFQQGRIAVCDDSFGLKDGYCGISVKMLDDLKDMTNLPIQFQGDFYSFSLPYQVVGTSIDNIVISSSTLAALSPDNLEINFGLFGFQKAENDTLGNYTAALSLSGGDAYTSESGQNSYLEDDEIALDSVYGNFSSLIEGERMYFAPRSKYVSDDSITDKIIDFHELFPNGLKVVKSPNLKRPVLLSSSNYQRVFSKTHWYSLLKTKITESNKEYLAKLQQSYSVNLSISRSTRKKAEIASAYPDRCLEGGYYAASLISALILFLYQSYQGERTFRKYQAYITKKEILGVNRFSVFREFFLGQTFLTSVSFLLAYSGVALTGFILNRVSACPIPIYSYGLGNLKEFVLFVLLSLAFYFAFLVLPGFMHPLKERIRSLEDD
jgi:hypothetical protein